MTSAQQAQKELAACQRMCEELKEKIHKLRQSTAATILTQMANNPQVLEYNPGQRKLCTGHFGKIYALHWGHDSQYIVTASQDGKLIIWNSLTGNKQLAITLNSAWVMTCAFADSYDYIASGGLDNTVSVFRTTPRDSQGPESKFKSKELYQELEKHDGYLSCARFLKDSDSKLISASGDGTCILWDVETHTPTSIFMDHTGDVMSIALNRGEKNANTFVSGSVDATAKVWDTRKGEKSVANFPGHEADINSVTFFPDDYCVLTGSDDGSVRMFDLRSYRQLNTYINTDNKSLHCQEPAGVTSVDVSYSGQYIFSAYDNGHVFMWSTLKGADLCDLDHGSRVSSLGVSPNGYALATGCWDFNLRIFA